MTLIALTQLPKRLFAWGLAKANATDPTSIKLTNCREHSNLADLKRSLLGQLQGTVLEIGPGAGAIFAYYPTDLHWIGVEPNPFMHSYLRQEATQRGFQTIELYEGTAEDLPVNAGMADLVVSSHVLCSVSSLDRALRDSAAGAQTRGLFDLFGTCGRRQLHLNPTDTRGGSTTLENPL